MSRRAAASSRVKLRLVYDSWVSAPRVERAEVPLVADERPMLEAWLDYHRATLLRKCAGLSDSQLKLRSAEPSTLSLLGWSAT
jgi:hypothetical protein